MNRTHSKIRSFKKVCELVQEAHADGKVVSFTSGCFDIFHVGHVDFLRSCRKGADLLVVGVDDNGTVRRAKGEEHPYFDETERMEVIAELESVSIIFLFRGPCSRTLLDALEPDIYCFSTFDPKKKEKRADGRAAGAKVRTVGDHLKMRSSSRAGRMIRKLYTIEPWNILPP